MLATSSAEATGSLTVTIDRGKDDGIEPDMAVIAARGVVGRVINPVSAHAATVQLLIGHSAAVAVTFERSKAGGMAVGGSIDPPLEAKFVPVLAEVQSGEHVMTSGQDGIYPPGLLVGTVERVSRANAGEREIAIRPAVDFSHVDIVLIALSHLVLHTLREHARHSAAAEAGADVRAHSATTTQASEVGRLHVSERIAQHTSAERVGQATGG